MRQTFKSLFVQRNRPWPKHPQSSKSEGTIEHEQLVTELITRELPRRKVNSKTKQGTDDGDPRHPAVVDLTVREQSEGKEPQQRSIGIPTKNIDSVDDTRGVGNTEDEDEDDKEHGNGQMHAFA